MSEVPRCPFKTCTSARSPSTVDYAVRLFASEAEDLGIEGHEPLFRCARCNSVWREPVTNIIEPVGTVAGLAFTLFPDIGRVKLSRGAIYSTT